MTAASTPSSAVCVSVDPEADPRRRQEALQRLANGETLVDVARTFGVDRGKLLSRASLRQIVPTRRPELSSVPFKDFWR